VSELIPQLRTFSARIDAVLQRLLPPEDQEPCELHRAMRYAVLGGGKRLRPLLVYATGQMLGASLDVLDIPAAAVELIHAYSLVHDDLPAMDNDDLRRGRPTCHIQFGQATAILVGDALQSMAFEVLAAPSSHLPHSIQINMISHLTQACGSCGMVGGQAFDLAATGKTIDLSTLERMHIHKTGALIRASVRLGALTAGCGDPARLKALDGYAHCIGLAFQIRDDILDVEGDPAVIGKRQGADQQLSKPTYPSLLGVSRTREQLIHLINRAILSLIDFGDSADLLRRLANYIAMRDK